MIKELAKFIKQTSLKVDQVLIKQIFFDYEIKKQNKDMEFFRNIAFYKLALSLTILGLVPIFYGSYLFFSINEIVAGVLEISSYFLLVIITFSKRISLAQKRISLIVVVYGLSVALILYTGLEGAGFLTLMATFVLAGCLLDKKQEAEFFLINILVFITLTWLIFAGYLNAFKIAQAKEIWEIMLITSQSLGMSLMIIITNIFISLEEQTNSVYESRVRYIESEKQYRSLFEYSGTSIFYVTTDGHIISYNKLAREFFNILNEDNLEKSVFDVFPLDMAKAIMLRIEKSRLSDGPEEYIDNITSSLGSKWYSSVYNKVLGINGEITGIQVITLDITERKIAEIELQYNNYHDFLTGLYNRRFFEEEMSRLDTPRNLPISVIMADVNGLKLVNDSLGHSFGDELLKEVSSRLKEIFRADEIIARVGGDEFAIILPNTSEEKAHSILNRIHNLNNDQANFIGLMSVSYGVQTKNNQNEKLVDILKMAENNMYKSKMLAKSSLRSQTIQVIMNTLYEKSTRELAHSKRVSHLCFYFAHKLKLEDSRISAIEIAGLVHDIGKIGVDEKILNKDGRLDHNEWVEIKKHSEAGRRILSSASEFSEISMYVLSHHEKWDGSGYPSGLVGQEIPFESRIISICDAYDAMTSIRSYKAAVSKESAIKELEKCSGTHFDPDLVDFYVNNVITDEDATLNQRDAN